MFPAGCLRTSMYDAQLVRRAAELPSCTGPQGYQNLKSQANLLNRGIVQTEL